MPGLRRIEAEGRSPRAGPYSALQQAQGCSRQARGRSTEQRLRDDPSSGTGRVKIQIFSRSRGNGEEIEWRFCSASWPARSPPQQLSRGNRATPSPPGRRLVGLKFTPRASGRDSHYQQGFGGLGRLDGPMARSDSHHITSHHITTSDTPATNWLRTTSHHITSLCRVSRSVMEMRGASTSCMARQSTAWRGDVMGCCERLSGGAYSAARLVT